MYKPKGTKKTTDGFSIASRNKNIFSYIPFNDNEILHIIYTTFNLVILLRNGTVISWGTNRSTLGRKCADSVADSFLAFPIRFPTKIVDITCGRNHCLARGTNYKVFSWGYNTYGQLGLSGFPMTTGSEKDEPSEIQSFMNIKIKQISASGNSSFAITEGGNNLYGWGDNKNGQLGINWERSEKVQTPKLIDLTDKFLSETVICQNKDGTKSFIAELFRPASNVSQAMIFFNNKRLHYKELELKSEVEKLELQEEQIKKRKGIFSINANQQDAEQLLKDISNLINLYSNKHADLIQSMREDKIFKHDEIIKSYEKQIDFQKEKETLTSKQLKNLEKTNNILELEKLTSKGRNKEELNNKKLETKIKQKNIIKIEKLIEDVNSGLHKNQHLTLEEQLQLKNKSKIIKEKVYRYKDYIYIFSEVRNQTKEILSKRLEKESIKDFRSILENLRDDQMSLNNYLFKNYDVINPDSEYLSESIIKSGEYLEDLEDKVYDYNLDVNNILGKKAVNSFKNNILLSKMNNILLDKILLFSKLYYNKSFDILHVEDELNDQKKEIVDVTMKEKERIYQEEQQKIIEEEEEEMRNKRERNQTEDGINHTEEEYDDDNDG